MPRPRNIIQTVPLHVYLPVDVRARLDLYLHSDVEGKVPSGAYQRFLGELLRQFFESEHLDLAPYLGTLPGTAIIRGSGTTINQLKDKLNGPVS